MKSGVEQTPYWLLQETGRTGGGVRVVLMSTTGLLVSRLMVLSSCPDVSPMKVSADGWVLANVNISGYYRVNYDLTNWERLLSLLSTDHQVRTTPGPADRSVDVEDVQMLRCE